MALLLQAYQEKRELGLRCRNQNKQTKTLGIQTSLQTIPNGSSYTETTSGASAPFVHPTVCASTVGISTQSKFQDGVEPPNDDIVAGVEPTSEASKVDPDP